MSIVLLLVATNVIAFIVPYIIDFSRGGLDSHYGFLSLGWKNNADIQDGEYYRLLTANFLHADFAHLFFNMYSLLNVGPSVVNIFGAGGFSIIYLLSGLSGSLFSFWFNPRPSVGASGAIFGLVGALLAFSLLSGQSDLFAQLFLIILVNAAYAFMTPQIDNWGHAGGLLMGFLVGFALFSTGIVL